MRVFFLLMCLVIGWKGIAPKKPVFIPKLLLKNDSGFVTKKEVLPFLLGVGLTDTISPNFSDWWGKWKETDTLGKYYIQDKGGNFLLCVFEVDKEDTLNTHLLIELKKDGTLKKCERIFQGGASFCEFGEFFYGFSKHGKYFTLTFCTHGSGFGGEWDYILDTIRPQEEMNPICRRNYSAHGGENFGEQSISSSIKLTDSNCIVHYFIRTDTYTEKTNKTKWGLPQEMEINYTLKNGKWEADDSSKFKGMDIFY